MTMDENLLLEQYSRYKKLALDESPYKCLLDTSIEINPHQINAFCAAIHSLNTGGIVLADEVGLGKTIEAGLVLKHVLASGAKRILISFPATLRKQWEIELNEKFGLKVLILDRLTVEHDFYDIQRNLEKSHESRIILASYDYSSKLMKRFPNVKWDFVVIDEAHNLRNVFHGTKRARNLYEMTKGIPKILLTATPLQNSLSDLHGLISFIDSRIFGTEKVFNKRFIEGEDYAELKTELTPVLYRTLRKDVSRYMAFSRRECHTVDFSLSVDEAALYASVDSFLKRDNLYSIPTRNSGLITLVIRKLLASSSFALVDTFTVLKKRLEKMIKGTKSAKAQDGFDLFWSYVEDEIDEDDFDNAADDDKIVLKQQLESELSEVKQIIALAGKIKTNAKIVALKTALKDAFEYQTLDGISQKAVIFTESKRTQKYIAEELRKDGYDEKDILLFNGDFDDSMTKEIYQAWQAKNFGKNNYGRSVEYKHAIVDYFKNHAKILVVTDAGSEGLNLQFCNTVINYDLPWNPQKIEQRIGRCHRYGQKNDVVAINLLNTQNEADKRVYAILSKKFELFDGVFGASDIALGTLESGLGFEKQILEIYQRCRSRSELIREFDKLERHLDAKRDKKARELRHILLTQSADAKGVALDRTKKEIDTYLKEVEYWEQISPSGIKGNEHYWKIDHWGEDFIGSHGTLFLGAFCNGVKMLFPILLLCDEQGEYVDFEESELVAALEKAEDKDIHDFKPTAEEKKEYGRIYDRLQTEMLAKYRKSTEPVMTYNKRKVENWAEIQAEQLNFRAEDLKERIASLTQSAAQATEFLDKIEIRKKIDEIRRELEHFQERFHEKVSEIQLEAEREIAEFNKQFDITPILLVNVILKF